jgi:hypothetical protein
MARNASKASDLCAMKNIQQRWISVNSRNDPPLYFFMLLPLLISCAGCSQRLNDNGKFAIEAPVNQPMDRLDKPKVIYFRYLFPYKI